MNKDIIILTCSWMIALFSLLFLVPKRSRKYAHITFLFGQAIAWVFEYLQLVFGWIEFPFREFKYATKMSFSLHYLFFPTIGVFFNLWYPVNTNLLFKFGYYLIFSIGIATYILVLGITSDLYKILHWNWFLGVLSDFIVLFLIRRFTYWFRKGLKTPS
ncbi:CBO0543 family protein [Bacillus sp. B1-b2]|uniref:CBO0543 family protein n=1 Tax=Bacillus sp. B1-b2 TaxID=2653201 RepID=UPI001261FBAA|nr:CBO0543 family protein [Bacillus sp. B1-b2]KAB7665121.1 hypothetical protein F9279_21375 [Bacillus sp. B1-b2]